MYYKDEVFYTNDFKIEFRAYFKFELRHYPYYDLYVGGKCIMVGEPLNRIRELETFFLGDLETDEK